MYPFFKATFILLSKSEIIYISSQSDVLKYGSNVTG